MTVDPETTSAISQFTGRTLQLEHLQVSAFLCLLRFGFFQLAWIIHLYDLQLSHPPVPPYKELKEPSSCLRFEYKLCMSSNDDPTQPSQKTEPDASPSRKSNMSTLVGLNATRILNLLAHMFVLLLSFGLLIHRCQRNPVLGGSN